jgi:phosphatidate phosphatase
MYLNKKELSSTLRYENASSICHSYGIDLTLLHVFMFVTKMLTGSHRPHFFELCKPDALESCVPGTFISDFECTNAEVKHFRIYEASQSFFSGHAATFIYSTTFVAYYLQRRIKLRHKFVIPFIQTILLLVGYFGAISRLLDNNHHLIDVVAGGLFGLLMTTHAVSR